jgi:hypothetical protein
MSSQSRLSAWKKLLLSKKDLDSSNMHFDKIKKASVHSISFAKAFEEISKNEGISFLFLDPSETHLQVLHHGHVLGGNWSSPTKKLVAILGTDSDAKPVQIITKSVKNIKEKSHSIQNFLDNIKDEEAFRDLSHPDADFFFKNIIPIPNCLTKIFIQIPMTSPCQVAKTFLTHKSDPVADTSDVRPPDFSFDEEIAFQDNDLVSGSPIRDLDKETSSEVGNEIADFSLDNIDYVIQFCHLCTLGKILPLTYSASPDSEITLWFSSLVPTRVNIPSSNKRAFHPTTDDTDDASEISSPENKVSKKDHYLINTMIKLHDTMDKSSKSKEDKEPGFKRLESHSLPSNYGRYG